MSDDLIKRSDAIKAVWGNDINPSEDGMVFEAQSHIDRDIKLIPSADRPQGEWKRRLVDNGFNADWVCSECGYRVKTDFVSFNYCPNCGADMRERKESE